MKKKHFIILFFFLIPLLIIFFIPPLYLLVMKEYPDGNLFFKEMIIPGQRFSLIYNHSVVKTPVWEFFEINKDGQLLIKETHFLDHGAGLPYAAFEEEIFVSEEGRFKIKNMNRKLDLPVYYRISKDRENILIYGEKQINLSTQLGETVLAIHLEKINLYEFLLHKIND